MVVVGKKRVWMTCCILLILGIAGMLAWNELSCEKVAANIMIEDKKSQETGGIADQMAKDEKAIRAVYDAMYEDELSRNIDHLSGLLTDDYVLIHMTGMHQSKEEYLRCVRDGELHYFTAETEHVSIEMQGEDRAVLTGQSRVNAAVFGGGRHTWPLQLVITMVKQNGRWLMDEAVASTY